MKNYEEQLQEDLREARIDLENAERSAEKARWKIEYISGLLGGNLFQPKPQDIFRLDISRITTIGYGGMTTPQVIAHILRESGQPMRIKDMVTAAIKKGYGGPEADPDKVYANFSSILSRAVKDENHPLFRKVEYGVFALAPDPSNENQHSPRISEPSSMG
jgi:hypothetical protein